MLRGQREHAGEAEERGQAFLRSVSVTNQRLSLETHLLV